MKIEAVILSFQTVRFKRDYLVKEEKERETNKDWEDTDAPWLLSGYVQINPL